MDRWTDGHGILKKAVSSWERETDREKETEKDRERPTYIPSNDRRRLRGEAEFHHFPHPFLRAFLMMLSVLIERIIVFARYAIQENR